MYKVQLENMLVQHVYPEFKNSLGYLRARVGTVFFIDSLIVLFASEVTDILFDWNMKQNLQQ